jgi:hypothetical protein
MSHFKSTLQWLAFATVFNLSLYFGLVEGIQGAANIAQFYIWFFSVLSLFALSDKCVRDVQQKANPLISLWLVNPQNLAVLALLLWYGWIWSACAWMVKIILSSRFRKPLPPLDPSAATV